MYDSVRQRQISVALPASAFVALRSYVEKQPLQPSLAQVVRAAVLEFLKREGELVQPTVYPWATPVTEDAP